MIICWKMEKSQNWLDQTSVSLYYRSVVLPLIRGFKRKNWHDPDLGRRGCWRYNTSTVSTHMQEIHETVCTDAVELKCGGRVCVSIRWGFQHSLSLVKLHPDSITAAIAILLEHPPSLLHVEGVLGHNLWIHIIICIAHKVHPLLSILAHHLCIAQLQCFRIARFFGFV